MSEQSSGDSDQTIRRGVLSVSYLATYVARQAEIRRPICAIERILLGVMGSVIVLVQQMVGKCA